MQHKCYTYLIKCVPTNQCYYGVRWANTCEPKQDLWNHYFTSSKYVKDLIKQHGIKAFKYEIRKEFDSKEKAIAWEEKVLKRINIFDKQQIWLNRCVSKAIRFKTHPMLGKKLDPAFVERVATSNRGKKRTEAQKEARKIARPPSSYPSGINHWTYKHGKSKPKTAPKKSPGRGFTYKLIDPDGNELIVKNLAKFSKDNQLSACNLLTNPHKAKGWVLIEKIL
jgi:hypothetical protein